MNPWAGLRKLPRDIWILSATAFVNRMGTMALPFLVLYLTRSRAFTAAQAGLVLAAYGLVGVFASPLAGKLVDRAGPVRMMRASLLLSGIAMALYPLASSGPAILALTVAWSLVTEMYRPANMTVVSDLVKPSQFKQAFAMLRLAINLGMSVGPALGGFLAVVSFPSLFWVDAGTTLAAAAILWRYFDPKLPPRPHKHAGPDGAPALTDPRRAISDTPYLIFLGAAILMGIVFFQHESAMPLYMVRDLRMKESTYGFMFTINTLLIVFLEVWINSATASWSHRRTLSTGGLLFAIGFGAMALAHDAWGIAATVVIWTFGEMILFPGMSAYVSEISPPGKKGEYMGLYTMTFSISFMLGPWLGTLALDRFGATALWALTFAVGILSSAVLSRTRVKAEARA